MGVIFVSSLPTLGFAGDGADEFSHDSTARVNAVGVPFEYDGDPYPELLHSNFGILNSDGSGRMRLGAAFALSFGEFLNPPVDYDGDGLDDLIRIDNGQFKIAINEPTSTFEVIVAQDLPSYDVVDQVPMQLNADGLIDFLVLFDSGDIYHLLSNGFGNEYTFELRGSLGLVATNAGEFRDVDGDGDLDVLLRNENGCDLAIQGSDGSWGVTGSYGDLFHVRRHALLDFDQDGDLDVALFKDRDAFLLRNNEGMLEFVAQKNLSGSFDTGAFRVADVNQDGQDDVIFSVFVVTPPATTVTGAMLSNGDPTSIFDIQLFDDEFGSNLGVADLDGDGLANELIQRIQTPTIAEFIREGIGIYRVDGAGAPVELSKVYCKVSNGLILMDLQSDGDLDLVFGTDDAQSTVLLNDGNANFTDSETYIDTGITEFQVSDLNLDGYPDVAVVSSYTDELIVRFGDGDGQFPSETRYTVGQGVTEIQVGDLDQDGDDDLVVTRQNPGAIVALYNDGAGGFAQTIELIANANLPRSTRLGDLNQDGVLDIVYGNIGSHKLEVRYSMPGGGYLPAIGFTVPNVSIRELLVQDLNGDSRPDVVIGGPRVNQTNDATLSVAMNTGIQGFLANAVSWSSPMNTNRLLLADMNADGVMDIVQVGYLDQFTENHNIVRVLLLNADGTVSAEVHSELGERFDFQSVYSIFVDDFNHDGTQDLLMFQSLGGISLYWVTQYLNIGDGSLMQYETIGLPDPITVDLTTQPYESQFEMIDVDLDGDLDFITGSYELGVIRVVENFDSNYCRVDLNADGIINFFDVSLLLIGYQAQAPFADWNGDGAWDYFDVSGFIMDYLAGCP